MVVFFLVTLCMHNGFDISSQLNYLSPPKNGVSALLSVLHVVLTHVKPCFFESAISFMLVVHLS